MTTDLRSTTVRRYLAVVVVLVALVLSGCASETVGERQAREAGGSSPGAEQNFSSILPEGDPLVFSKQLVAESMNSTEGFTPPVSGPEAQKPGARLAFVGSDLTNGGIISVSQGVEEAAGAIGWTVDAYDGKATAQGRSDALNQAIASQPDVIVLGGFDPTEQASTIKRAVDANIPVVGWHAGPEPGPGNDLFTNVTTDALKVSQLAAAYAVDRAEGKAGVAIFTDGQYDIAVLKAKAMEAYIKACSECSVVSYQDSPIAEADQRMPGIISNLLQSDGDSLTSLLAINGNYFSGTQQALRSAGRSPDQNPIGVAAGDGDSAEFQRIRSNDYQAATVAEPLLLHGWQLVDEANRALAGEGPSDFVAAPALITSENVPAGDTFDPDSGYRDAYKKLWGK